LSYGAAEYVSNFMVHGSLSFFLVGGIDRLLNLVTYSGLSLIL
jgi:hypothetical protein